VLYELEWNVQPCSLCPLLEIRWLQHEFPLDGAVSAPPELASEAGGSRGIGDRRRDRVPLGARRIDIAY
jgi:hypothetical protein